MSNRLLKTLPGGQGRAEAATGPPRAFQVQPEQLDKPYATTKGQSPMKFPSAVIQMWDITKQRGQDVQKPGALATGSGGVILPLFVDGAQGLGLSGFTGFKP